MKDLIQLAKIAKEAEQVFLPNRYQEPFVEALQRLTGEEVSKLEGRRLSVRSGGKTYRWARGRNIPKIVEAVAERTPNISTVGLTGSEWCLEYDLAEPKNSVLWDSMTESKLGNLALIAPSTYDIREICRGLPEEYFRPLPVVTVFPNIVRSLGTCGSFTVCCELELDGGVESVADALGVAAIDLVSSGKTLQENNFVVLEELMPVYVALVRAARDK